MCFHPTLVFRHRFIGQMNPYLLLICPLGRDLIPDQYSDVRFDLSKSCVLVRSIFSQAHVQSLLSFSY